MRKRLKLSLCLLPTLFGASFGSLAAVTTPQDLHGCDGDRSVALYWRPAPDSAARYLIARAGARSGPFRPLNAGNLSRLAAWSDLQVLNNQPYYYRVAAVDAAGSQSAWSKARKQSPKPFADEDRFLDYVQETAFRYFWHSANPENGLVPDRVSPGSPCSVAATGFGLTAIGIGVDHGWVSRAAGRARTLTTLRALRDGPQRDASAGAMGFRGWFYHFLDMETGHRYTRFNTELSSIDTALLLAGVIYAREYFHSSEHDDREIRQLADAILARVDWQWMADRSQLFRMGWQPATGFLAHRWSGYSEATLLYLLAIGAEKNPAPPSAWRAWTATFTWRTNYALPYLEFPPLFGHQYSQCWLDLRWVADDYMRQHGATYFENSRRATHAQNSYCIANPGGHKGYGTHVWGLTASDGPNGYRARGAPPALNDDGTIAPTAVGGSTPFAPEISLPTLRHFYDQYRVSVWTAYGFRDAFNLGGNWWASDVLGIDQGAILIMIENHRTGRVWQTFMRNTQVRQGLSRAGFR